MDASLRKCRVGEFEIRQENIDYFCLFAEHFDAGVAGAVPDERQIRMVFADGFAKPLDVGPPMLWRHEIEIVDAFCDQIPRFGDQPFHRVWLALMLLRNLVILAEQTAA